MSEWNRTQKVTEYAKDLGYTRCSTKTTKRVRDVSHHVCFTCGKPWDAFGGNVAAGCIRICPECKTDDRAGEEKVEDYVKEEFALRS